MMSTALNNTWLVQKLAQNGFTLDDLSSQTGLPVSVLEQLAQSEKGSSPEWDTVLDILNQYPSVRYPAADILQDIDADIEQFTDQAMCNVYYGVSDNSLVFCEYQCLDGGNMHGANVDAAYLSCLQLPLSQLKELMIRQNCTIGQE